MYNVQFLLIYYFRDAKVLIFLDKRTKKSKKICSNVLMSEKKCVILHLEQLIYNKNEQQWNNKM